MDKIVIRAATPGDHNMLSELLAAAYGALRGSYDPRGLEAALPFMSRANPRLLASGTYYVAEIDGIAAGCGGWSAEKPGSGEVVDGIGHIRHFATHPAFLRLGVARRLLEHCLREAAEAGVKTMMSQSTLPAETFYASAGFRSVGQVEVEMAPGLILPAIDMRLELSDRRCCT